MAMLPNVFQAEKHDKMGFSVLPAGWYPAEITKSEIKDNRAGTGKILKLQFKIIDHEEYKGRMVFANLNIIHQNQVAVEIAEKELATICEACGVGEVEDTDELHDIPLGIKLSIRPETAQWPETNEIKGYCDVEKLNEKGDDTTNPKDNPFK